MKYVLNRGGYVSTSVQADIFSCRSTRQLPAYLQVHTQFKQFCMPPHSYLPPIDKRSPQFTRVSAISTDRIGILQWIYFDLSDPFLISCHPHSDQTVKRSFFLQSAYIQIVSDAAWAVPYRSSLPSLSDSKDSFDQGYEIVQSA
jgi:hypothetical protein